MKPETVDDILNEWLGEDTIDLFNDYMGSPYGYYLTFEGSIRIPDEIRERIQATDEYKAYAEKMKDYERPADSLAVGTRTTSSEVELRIADDETEAQE